MKERRLRKSQPLFSPGVSLVRALSKMGYGSRGQALDWIEKGLVRVNGLVEKKGSRRVDLARDRVEVEGRGNSQGQLGARKVK